MSICKIASGITFDCTDSMIPGIDATQMVVFNKSDIDYTNSVVVGTQLQSLVTLGSPTAVGYVYEGVNNSITADYASVDDGFNPNKYNHNVGFRIFSDSAFITDIEQFIVAADGFVIVLFTKENLVKVAGFDVGLKANLARNYYEEEGAAVVTYATREVEYERKPFLTYVGSASPQAGFEALKAEILALT